MQDPRASLKKLVQLGVLVYLLVAIAYTTAYMLAYPLSSLSWSLFGLGGTSFRHPESAVAKVPASPRVDLISATLQEPVSLDDNEKHAFFTSFLASDDSLYWLDNETGDYSTSPIREKTFLAKAFSQAMHPTKIIPYFYKASGPISVTIHIPLPISVFESNAAQYQFTSAVRSLEALYASSPHFANYVDVHLALSPFSGAVKNQSHPVTTEGGRQFNVWRNVARLFARTEFVMMLDVDFAVCTDWRSTIRDAITRYGGALSDVGIHNRVPGLPLRNDTMKQAIFDELREGTAALVIPAFEYVKQEDGIDQQTFPRDKESLVHLTSSKPAKITSFHSSWAPGHNSTDYPRYFSIPPGTGEIYKVSTYQSAYEPYVITSKRVSWCDERFTGYGGNKAACLFEMYLSGVSFYVMSDHFLIHQSHKYEEEVRREERKYNRKLYADFKEEACLRYLYKFHIEGILRTPQASNVLEECKKMKSVVKLATELLGEDISDIMV
ncbi:hypothetical protein NM688_g6262 [Phlebia brevispora]|uniref:Uncharacterized protein n=1 Tax=Phlebia brevispora TaxID=194682 RepID=A0ACC1SHX5_9APHY|nr:hypothetical protein NM688_g6262 [Phlebia brevispora]